MNKTNIDKELRQDNGFWNTVKKICGIRVSCVMWDNKPYKVINEGLTFEDITKTKSVKDETIFNLTYNKRIYKPIATFKLKAELVDYINKNQK